MPVLADAPGWNDVESPPDSNRLGADAGPELLRPIDFCLSVSALYRVKISSMAFKLSSFAWSCTLEIFGVLLRLTPRFRAFPKGPFSSGMRRWEVSELMYF